MGNKSDKVKSPQKSLNRFKDDTGTVASIIEEIDSVKLYQPTGYEMFENPNIPKYISRNLHHTMPIDARQILTDILMLRGWDKRLGQVQMVDVINNSIHNPEFRWTDIDIAVNAPVGTGKTLAYLVACLANKMRVVIATVTKGLQDQIMQEELPRLRKDLIELYGYELTYGTLKGKSNYPCARTVKMMLSGDVIKNDPDNQLFSSIDIQPDQSDIPILEEIDKRIDLARATGDSLTFDAEHLLKRLRYDAQSHVRASKRCAGKSEPWVDIDLNDGPNEDILGGLPIYAGVPREIACQSECIYRAAYAHAMDSQVVVVNTTLLIFEIMRANSPMGGETKPSILRGVGMIIIDEAHHLFANISEAYSVSLDFGGLKKEAADIVKRLNRRYSNPDTHIPSFNQIIDIIEQSEEALDNVIDDNSLTETIFRQKLGKELDQLAKSVEGFTLYVLSYAAKAEREKPSGIKLTQTGVPKVINSLIYALNEYMDNVTAISVKIIQGKQKEGKKKVDHFNSLSYSDADSDHLELKTVPIDVSFFRAELTRATKMANPYVPERRDMRSIITLSSGTITHNTPAVVGMDEPIYLDVETPFDPAKVRVYVPLMYDPSHAEWRDDAWVEIAQAIRKVGGRTLSLHTAIGRMNEFTAMARNELEPEGYTILTQSSGMSKLGLIEALRSTPKTVLFGTRSFMEGVDIQGSALSLVILDKIPFPQVDDAMFEARRQFVRKRHFDPKSPQAGSEAFIKVDVDFASVMLAQSFGRLIRSVDDVGGIMILDHRILTKGYSSKLTKLLPQDWAVTRDQVQFMKWLEWVNPDTREGEMPKIAKDGTWVHIGGTAIPKISRKLVRNN